MRRSAIVSIIASAITTAIPLAAHAQCPTAVNLNAESQGCDVRLTWQNAAGAAAPSAWAIFRREAGSGPNYTQINTVLPGNTIYTDTTADVPGSYVYFVRALVSTGPCASSTLDSALVSGSTSLVPKLSPPLANCSSITLRWSGFPGASSFALQRRIGTGSFSTIATLPPTTLLYTDTSVQVGQSYDFRLATTAPCGVLTQAGFVSGATFTPPVEGVAPASIIKRVGESATITFDITAPATPIFQESGILRDGVPVTPSSRVSIAPDGQSISIASLRPEDMGEYTYTVSNACATISQRVILAVRANPCRADFNNSGGSPTVQDIFDFLAEWFAGCP